MAYVDWQIKGAKIGVCNCNYGCPCQFYAPPTYEKCEGLDVLDIEEGHFGAISLDGLRVGLLAGWPGAIHEGEGVSQVILDQRADEDRREALYKIASGRGQGRPKMLIQIGFPMVGRNRLLWHHEAGVSSATCPLSVLA